MKFKLVALFLAVLTLVVSGTAWANDAAETQWTRDQARQKNMTLIDEARVREIASKQLEGKSLTFTEIDLENEADDYPNGTDFRPVYKVECRSGMTEYDVDIDAVTGQVLKCRVDD